MAAHKLAGANCKCSQAPEHIGGPLTAGDTPGTEHQHQAEAKQEEAEEEVVPGPIVLGTSYHLQHSSELLEAEVPASAVGGGSHLVQEELIEKRVEEEMKEAIVYTFC